MMPGWKNINPRRCRNINVKHTQGSVRLTQGKLKGRNIRVPDLPDLRPVPQMARVAIFNRFLNDLKGITFLDLFSGSGVMGFEALSRGADSVTFVEKNRQLCQAIRKNFELFSIKESLGDIKIDESEINFQKTDFKNYHVIFADPPFEQPQWIPLLVDFIDKHKVLPREGQFILKTPKFYPLVMETENIKLQDTRHYGGISIFWFES